METLKEKRVAALDELIIINNDRYEGYKRAAEETTDPDLKALFNKFSAQSSDFSSELRKWIPLGETLPERDETKASGKFYRAWMDVKAAVTANNRKAILSSCEFGEDVAKRTYDAILENPEDVSGDLIAVIRKQRGELQVSHDRIKALRDTAETVN
jgi:uncharacterized protein (TIGR02284 family)